MEFEKFPKIPRYNRNIIITEKIDGTNGQIVVQAFTRKLLHDEGRGIMAGAVYYFDSTLEDVEYAVWAGSRNRWLNRVGSDNHGFAQWVFDNGRELVKELGVGRHYGEWWGQGIARKYGLDHKRFSLFNTKRWTKETTPACCHVVPHVYEGPWKSLTGQDTIEFSLSLLRQRGSLAAPGYMDPEGIVIFHAQGNLTFKVTLEGDEGGKEYEAVS